MTNLEIDFFEYNFNKICDSVVWTTDFEEEYDPDEQWEHIKEKMFQAVNEVLTLPDGLGTNDCVTADEVDQLLTTIFIKRNERVASACVLSLFVSAIVMVAVS